MMTALTEEAANKPHRAAGLQRGRAWSREVVNTVRAEVEVEGVNGTPYGHC